MTTYAIPSTVAPSAVEFGLISNTWRFVSPFTGHQQTLAMPGARWKITVRWNWLKATEAGEYEAFLMKLRGGEHNFSAHNFFRPAPLGTLRGTLTVTTGTIAAGATTGAITGGAGQASKTLLAGDLVSINGELKMITANATTNGSGVATIFFEPPMRAAASVGASVVWDKPTATFVKTDRETGWQYERSIARGFVLDGEEIY